MRTFFAKIPECGGAVVKCNRYIVRVLLWRLYGIKSVYCVRGENPRGIWVKNAPVFLENKSLVFWNSLCEHHLRT